MWYGGEVETGKVLLYNDAIFSFPELDRIERVGRRELRSKYLKQNFSRISRELTSQSFTKIRNNLRAGFHD
jgi:hypothetical protein